MNTATRVLNTQAIGLQKLHIFSFTQKGIGIVLLIIALFFSAFALVYVKDLNRRLFIRAQILQKENIFASEQWGKLLLEQSTLAGQARIHRLAQSRLDMIVPNLNAVLLVKE